MSQQGFPAHATLMWTPADWAWIGGLFDVLLPSWHHGVAVVATDLRNSIPGGFRFDGESRWSHTFLPPTALKMMRSVARPERLEY